LRLRKHHVEGQLNHVKAEFVRATVAGKPEAANLKTEIGILEEELEIWANSKNDAEKFDRLKKLKDEAPPPPYDTANDDSRKKHSKQSGSG
jgi:hypothetical protein